MIARSVRWWPSALAALALLIPGARAQAEPGSPPEAAESAPAAAPPSADAAPDAPAVPPTASGDAAAAEGAPAGASSDAEGTPAEAKAADAKGDPAEDPRLEAMMDAYRRFEAQASDYRQEVQLIIERKYREKREELASRYEKAIRDLEVIERKQRLDAIAQFEEFLSRYPDEPRYTPDAMMRLAELYYEQTEDDFRLAEREYYARLDELQGQGDAELPPPPQRRYEKPIGLYQRIVTQFPSYRYNDAAYYLLGYLLGEQDELQEALATFDALIRKYPESRFVPEVWMRIGEYYFDADQTVIPDALQRAIVAYTNALPFKDHPLYDKVLYKLGWTYYRIDDYDHAVQTFFDLLQHYQSKAEAEGEEVAGGDLRQEAIQYTAVSFADEAWGSLDKAKEMLAARGHPPFEFEVLRRLGDVYFDLTKFPLAVQTYKELLARAPLHPEAPVIQEKIVTAYEKHRAFESAFQEQEILVRNYSEGTPWYEAHKDEPEVLALAGELTEKSLRASAIFHHKQAQTSREEGDVERAFAEYQIAAKSYGEYLRRFPHTKELYDFQYYYADALYNSAQFMEAAKYFAAVRDSNLDATYLEDSALGAVLSYEKEIARRESAGELPPREVLTSSTWPENQPVAPVDVPEVKLALVEASDQYVKRLPDSERAPAVAYKAGEVYYVYNHHEEARRRFEEVVRRWPMAEPAQYAANLILETFLIAKDWKAVEETSARLLATRTVQEAGGEVADTFLQFKLGGRFNRAQELFESEQYEEAARLYLALVDEAPQHEFADKALYNAAICYSKVLRFESALQLYARVFSEYPKSDLADKALFLVAYNAEKAFDYDKAIDQYLLLVNDYPESPERQGALNNAAILLYLTQDYRRAAQQFVRYARLYPDASDTPRILLLAAEAREKLGQPREAITAYREFIRRYRGSETNADQVVEARLKIAKAHEASGQQRAAIAAYAETVDEYERLGLDPKSLASLYAAEAQFNVAEDAFARYDAIKIVAGGRGQRFQRNLKAILDKKKTTAAEVSKLYKQVYVYKRLDWTLAAAYRIGYVLERFAASLYEAPVPPELKRLGDEYIWAYQDQLAQIAIPIEEEAVKAYEAAYDEAKKAGIVNRWTKLTLESLARYRPNQYEILKEARDQMADVPLSPAGLAPTLAGLPPPAPVGTRLGDEGPGDAASTAQPSPPAEAPSAVEGEAELPAAPPEGPTASAGATNAAGN